MAERTGSPKRVVVSEREQRLLDELQSDDEDVRSQATVCLWELWFDAAGPAARAQLDRGSFLMSAGALKAALEVFDELVREHPEFAEGHNKRATALYLMRRYDESVRACKRTLELNPIHFGAWHGLGLNYLELEELKAAEGAFREALELQPHADPLRELVRRCADQLN